MKKIIVLLTLSTALIIGCSKKTSPEKSIAQQFLDLVESYRGVTFNCSHSIGNSTCVWMSSYTSWAGSATEYSLVSDSTGIDGHVVLDGNISYHKEFFGFDLNDSAWSGLKTALDGLSSADGATYLEGWMHDNRVYVRTAGAGYEGNPNWSGGTWTTFSEEGTTSKDLESMAAKIEVAERKSLEDRLVAEYGLSAEKGEKIARLVSQFQKLTSARKLTEKEYDKFSRELVGMPYKKAIEASMDEVHGYNQLLDSAAKTHDATPEQVQAIVHEIFFN